MLPHVCVWNSQSYFIRFRPIGQRRTLWTTQRLQQWEAEPDLNLFQSHRKKYDNSITTYKEQNLCKKWVVSWASGVYHCVSRTLNCKKTECLSWCFINIGWKTRVQYRWITLLWRGTCAIRTCSTVNGTKSCNQCHIHIPLMPFFWSSHVFRQMITLNFYCRSWHPS